MLALIQGVLCHVQPALELKPEFTLEAHNGHITLMCGNQPVVGDVRYFRTDKYGDVDPVTGEYFVTPGRSTTFRAVFMGRHIDLVIPLTT